MGDFEYRLTSQSVGAAPATQGGTYPWGFRASPSLRLNVDNFFSELRLEGFVGYDPLTPIGAHYFDASPSSTISDQSPVSAVVYQPNGTTDYLRSYFGIRQFTLGYRFTPDFQVRFGRNRYDLTESDRLMMTNTYTWQSQFADVLVPLHWLGGELRYDRVRPNENLRQLLFSASAWNGAGSSVMGLGQGLFTYALADGANAPRLTLTAYVSLRGNPQPATGPSLQDPGFTHGEGFATQFDVDFFTAAAALSHSYNTSHSAAGLHVTDDRAVGTLLLDFHPGNWRFHGMASFLSRAQASDADRDPAKGQTEIDTEVTAGYRIVDGLVASIGYRGEYGPIPNHMAFLGLTTSFNGRIPFSRSSN